MVSLLLLAPGKQPSKMAVVWLL
ncbi:hypothetical protein OIU79_009345 [Salix purpurea]|uniref:Uncharacterized protein n=1 Tax=Salix purpurea TaxID=77065 RepID=A0A9Q0TKR8_SALPP|nr:hypothetical protein OIU79_009345 [Salix purpurea]